MLFLLDSMGHPDYIKGIRMITTRLSVSSFRFMSSSLPVLLVFLSLSVTAGPASSGAHSTAEEAITERATARWDALISGDKQSAYELLTPATREALPFALWRNHFGSAAVTWKSASVKDIICIEVDMCRVVLTLDYTVSVPQFGIRDQPRSRPIHETWLLVDNEWWYYPAALPPLASPGAAEAGIDDGHQMVSE